MKYRHPILTLMASFAMASTVAAAEAAGAVPADEGFSPGLLFAALFFGAVLLLLVGIGIILGLVCLACAAVFVALGIVSSSALVAILRRRLSAGFRALHYQALVLLGWPCGIGALWLGCLLFDYDLSRRDIFIVGSVVGIAAGISVAFILDLVVWLVYRRFVPTAGSYLSV